MKHLILLGLIIISSCTSSQKKEKTTKREQPKEVAYLPLSPKPNQIIKHKYYTLSYSEENEQAEWVYYVLTPQFVNGTAKRKNTFKPDPAVKTGSSELSDYWGGNYDRGHLCPAADMKLSDESMEETFYLSNMSPQVQAFNRGIWQQLEDQVRDWVAEYQQVYIVTGPVFKNNKGTLGDNKVTIPGYYYKALYVPSTNKMIAFLLPNADGTKPIKDYAISVDSLESFSKINFYSQLTDDVENRLESTVELNQWTFKSNPTSSKANPKKKGKKKH